MVSGSRKTPSRVLDYTPFNLVDVVAHPADQVAFSLFCKKSQGEIEDFRIQVCPQGGLEHRFRIGPKHPVGQIEKRSFLKKWKQ